jgi:hypothetical protein
VRRGTRNESFGLLQAPAIHLVYNLFSMT